MTLSVVKSPASIDLSATGPTCDPLAFTGAPIAALVALGAALLVVGILLTVTARDRRARRVVFVTAVMIGAAIVAGGADSHQARAAEPPCSAAGTPDGPIIEPLTPAAPTVQDAEAQSPFQIGQISTNVGIAPGVAPTPITGRIANNGPRPIYLTAITVEISRVTTVPAYAAGPATALTTTCTTPSCQWKSSLPPASPPPSPVPRSDSTTNRSTRTPARPRPSGCYSERHRRDPPNGQAAHTASGRRAWEARPSRRAPGGSPPVNDFRTGIPQRSDLRPRISERDRAPVWWRAPKAACGDQSVLQDLRAAFGQGQRTCGGDEEHRSEDAEQQAGAAPVPDRRHRERCQYGRNSAHSRCRSRAGRP